MIDALGVCRAHAMTEEERIAFTRAGNAARREQGKMRKDGEEAKRMGLKAMLGARLEAEAERITNVLSSLLESEDEGIRLRAIEQWMSRVYGKAVQPTSDVTPELPADVEALRALTPEERRALLRAMPQA